MLIDGHPVGVSCVHPGGIRPTSPATPARQAATRPSSAPVAFARIARTTPQDAAKTILRGVQQGQPPHPDRAGRLCARRDAKEYLGAGYQRLTSTGIRLARRFGVSTGGL